MRDACPKELVPELLAIGRHQPVHAGKVLSHSGAHRLCELGFVMLYEDKDICGFVLTDPKGKEEYEIQELTNEHMSQPKSAEIKSKEQILKYYFKGIKIDAEISFEDQLVMKKRIYAAMEEYAEAFLQSRRVEEKTEVAEDVDFQAWLKKEGWRKTERWFRSAGTDGDGVPCYEYSDLDELRKYFKFDEKIRLRKSITKS